MRIAVNTRFLLKGKMEGFGWFTYETVKRIVESHPEHEFIFFFDRPFDQKYIFGKNVTPLVLSPPARHPILFKIWFNRKVTKALKQHKADLFFSPDGYLSLRTDVPQVGVIHDLNFEHHPEDLPGKFKRYLTKYFPLFAQKAAHIITVSNYSKQDIVDTYKIDPEKITVAHNGGSELYKPIAEDKKNQIKSKLTDGQEFFVYVGALHPRKNVERLMLAYDEVRKNTKSATKLVIVGEKLWSSNSMEETYKQLQHQQDIIFTGHLSIEELCPIVASAKALALVSYFEGFGIPVVEAMKCGVPVIVSNLTSLPEVAGDAGIKVDPYSIQDIAEGLAKFEADEDFCKNMGAVALQRSSEFNWDKSAEIIWSVLAKFE